MVYSETQGKNLPDRVGQFQPNYSLKKNQKPAQNILPENGLTIYLCNGKYTPKCILIDYDVMWYTRNISHKPHKICVNTPTAAENVSLMTEHKIGMKKANA